MSGADWTFDLDALMSTAGWLVAAVTLILSITRASRGEAEKATREMVTLAVKMDAISTDIAEVNTRLRNMAERQDAMLERVAKVEQSAAQAHRRIDELARLNIAAANNREV